MLHNEAVCATTASVQCFIFLLLPTTIPSHAFSPTLVVAGWLHAEPLGEIDLEVESSLLSYISSRNFPEEVSNLSFCSPNGRKVGLFEVMKNKKAS